jgi:hypothetical protein
MGTGSSVFAKNLLGDCLLKKTLNDLHIEYQMSKITNIVLDNANCQAIPCQYGTGEILPKLLKYYIIRP